MNISFLHLIKNKILLGQFLRYFAIGFVGVFLDILLLYILKEKFDFHPVLAVILNQIVMINYTFFINKYWSFASHGLFGKQMTKFLFLTFINYIFAIAWMYFFTEIIIINYLLARIVNIALAVVWNFILYKFWIFK